MKRKLINSLRLLLVAAGLCVGASAWGQVSTWTYSTSSNTYGAEFDGSTAGVVKVQLGATSEAASWYVHEYSGRKRGVSHNTNHTANLSEEVGQTAVPVSGTFMIVKPTVDVIFEVNGYSSDNIYVYLVSSETPTTNKKINGQYRVKNSWTCNAGTLKAGVTYYIYGDAKETAFTGFTATSYELYFLNLQIDKAQALYDDEANTKGRTAMNTALTTARTLAANASATTEQLNAGWKALENSKNEFMAANGNDTYGIESDELVWQGKVINAVAGMKMTYGGAADVNWTYDSGRGPGFHAGANASLTSGIPTAGTFVIFEPTSYGLLTLNWYAYATGGTVTATLIDADQTFKEVKTHSKSNGESNNSYTDDFTTLLRPGVTYYLYLQGTNYNNTFKGFVYTTKTEVEAAIYDCKACDNSAAFATAIDAGSFATAAEVYAFNTTYHITNGALTDGVRDITGVIRNAAIADGTDWDGATILNGEKYTGAPDEYYLDKNTGEIDASQTIYGLPAGVYVLKAATRAKAGTSGTIYVWDGANNHTTAINANGNTGGGLDKGWDWTEVEFTLTSTANVKIGFWADVDGYWASCDDFHMYKVESVNDVTVSAAGYATYVPSYDLNFTDTDIKAYKVKVSTKGKATMTQVNNVPAGTPVLLYKAGGATEDIPVMTGAAAVSDNDLVAGNATTASAGVATTDGDYTNLILNNVDDQIGFYYAAGQIVATNRAYLHILTTLAPDAVADSRMVMVFADETTGITSLTPSPSPKGEGSVYTLSGQRVEKPAKGLYIVNGKKVIIK